MLSVHQPYASLILAGIKRFETRPGPPNGDMRPEGVRAGVGGCSVNRGDIIGIASTALDTDGDRSIPAEAWDALGEHIGGDAPARGVLLGTVRVVDAYPMIDPELGWQYDLDTPEIAVLTDIDELHIAGPFDRTRDISSELPYGEWTPGRWAIELADPVPTTERCPVCPDQSLIGSLVVQCPSCRRGRWYGVGPCGSCGAPGPAGCTACGELRSCEPIPVSGLQGVWRLTADRLRGKAVA